VYREAVLPKATHSCKKATPAITRPNASAHALGYCCAVVCRGRRYGLCGGNGVGKSTLMRAISKGQLEGFPPPEKLKTVYVEHDIQVRGRVLERGV